MENPNEGGAPQTDLVLGGTQSEEPDLTDALPGDSSDAPESQGSVMASPEDGDSSVGDSERNGTTDDEARQAESTGAENGDDELAALEASIIDDIAGTAQQDGEGAATSASKPAAVEPEARAPFYHSERSHYDDEEAARQGIAKKDEHIGTVEAENAQLRAENDKIRQQASAPPEGEVLPTIEQVRTDLAHPLATQYYQTYTTQMTVDSMGDEVRAYSDDEAQRMAWEQALPTVEPQAQLSYRSMQAQAEIARSQQQQSRRQYRDQATLEVRQQYPDFDQYAAEVDRTFDTAPDANPVELAYLAAVGRRVIAEGGIPGIRGLAAKQAIERMKQLPRLRASAVGAPRGSAPAASQGSEKQQITDEALMSSDPFVLTMGDE